MKNCWPREAREQGCIKRNRLEFGNKTVYDWPNRMMWPARPVPTKTRPIDLLLPVLVWLAGGVAGATDPCAGFGVRVWQMEEGLPHNIVQAITQTGDGYLWVGTREGLARFDGVSFTVVELLPSQPHPSVRSLSEGPDGSLWIGTENAGLFRWHRGTLSHYGLEAGLKSEGVSQVLAAGDGTVWLGLREGVAQWREGKIHYPAHSALTNAVSSLCLDGQGALWVGGNRTLQRLEAQKVATFRTANGVPLRAVRVLICDERGTLWAGSNTGVTQVKAATLTYYPAGEGPAASVSAMLADRAGRLWVGTLGGLSRFEQGQWLRAQREDAASYGVFALFEDREGNLWVGSEEGLTRLTPQPFETYTRQRGLTQNAIASVCAGRDGSIWVGTWGGGVDRLQDGRVTVYDKANGLSSDMIMAVLEGRDGSLWAGTDGGTGLNRLFRGQVTHYTETNGLAAFVITALLEDRRGNIWIGSREGLSCYRNGAFRRYTTNDGLSHNKINALCEGRDGTLWVGTGAGLTERANGRWINRAATEPLLAPAVLSLYEDRPGSLWLGTHGAGLRRLAGGKVEVFTSRQGLFNDSIYALLEDDRANLWCNSSKGIFRVSKAELDQVARGLKRQFGSISYGKLEGVLSSGQYQEVTQPAACQGTDGRLWFRTTQGVAVVAPGRLTTNELPPPVVIEELVADGNSVPVAEPPLTAGSRRAPLRPLPVTLPPGLGELEIHYTALSFRAPEKNRFKYRLEGVDADWVEAGTRRVAYYSRLAPGHYSFRVVGCNNDGVWNQTGAALGLTLRPHVWQTWWFLSVCGLIAVLAIGGSARYATRRKLERSLEHLRQQHAIEQERARIARDMHDELGAKLTQISFQGAVARRSLAQPTAAAEQIEKMAQTARALVASLDEIVWAVDPANDSLENLASYLCRYASDFFEASAIACEFFIPASLPDCRLAADVRHHLFLAVKEALHNVLKHAQATHVELRLELTPAELRILIADNGRGLEPGPSAAPGKTRRAGHGLDNLRQRLALLKGRCEVGSETGEGTRIQLIVPLTLLRE